MKNMVGQSWDALPMPDTFIMRVSELSQVQPNYLDFLDWNKRPIGELEITGVNYGETEAPHIELIEPETDIDPILADAEALPELVERQDIPNVEQEKDMGIAKEDVNLESP